MNSTARGIPAITVILAILGPLSPVRASEGRANGGALPDQARRYIAKTYFDGCDPADRAIDEAVEILRIPQSLLLPIADDPWVMRQLNRFAVNKVFFLLDTPDGGKRVLMFRNGKKRKDKAITPARERVLRRLYKPGAFAEETPELLRRWLDRNGLVPVKVLERAVERVKKAGLPSLDEETLDRARKNLGASRDEGRTLARALGALGEAEHGDECTWAALWLISRMDRMAFHRKNRTKSVGDLRSVTARLFFENVYYAVKARNLFPWGRRVDTKDFLHHVLSPRATGEPLQRWRRHFFEALAPEFRDAGPIGMAEAVKKATAACYDLYQYEGATTWEDFGMLTALAVHEGRCEDCSNVQNCMIRALGLPACQAFTPWWAAGDGNHAWTVVPCLDGGKSRDGARAAKVFIKTWDGLDDVTDKNTPVTELRVSFGPGAGGRASLNVWNHDEWRTVVRADLAGGEAVFSKVGCSQEFVFLVRLEGSSGRLARVHVGGAVTWLDNGPGTAPGEGAFPFEFGKANPLGEFKPDEEYSLFVHTEKGWMEIPAERLSTGAVGFEAGPGRLYRLRGKGVSKRPFTVREGDDGGEPVLVKH